MKPGEQITLEEAQPLQSTDGHSHASGKGPKLPGVHASPDEVRIFCKQVLKQRIGLADAAAEAAANKWTQGSGRELHEYPVNLLIEVFGQEHAWVLCREVRVQKAAETMAVETPKTRKRFAATAVLMPLILCAVWILCGIEFQVVIWLTAVPTAIVLALWGLIAWVVPSDYKEDTVVAQLKHEFNGLGRTSGS